MWRYLLSLGAVTSSSLVLAAEKAVPSTANQLSQVIGGLALILVLIAALSWVAKKFSQGGFQQNAHLKIVAALPLGTRERLMVIDAGGTHILLGVTATNIQTLHVFEEPITPAASVHQESEFAKKLMSIIQAKSPLGAGSSEISSNEKPAP